MSVGGDTDPRAFQRGPWRGTFVPLLSDSGVPLEEISRLVGHSGTAVTEEIYGKQIRPVSPDRCDGDG